MAVHHLAFASKDMGATAEFYMDVMGFELVKTVVGATPTGGWSKHVFFDTGGGSMIAFWELHDDTIPDSWSSAISTGLGLPVWVNHLAFAATLDELDVRTKAWTEAGYDVSRVDHEFCISIYTRDPNGIMVEWCADTRVFNDDDRREAQERLLDPHPDPSTFDGDKLVEVVAADPVAKAARKARLRPVG